MLSQRISRLLMPLLFVLSGCLNGASIKKLNGTIIEGKIDGLIILLETQEVTREAGKLEYSSTYLCFNGKHVNSITENGINWAVWRPPIINVIATKGSPINDLEAIQAGIVTEGNQGVVRLGVRMKSGGEVIATSGEWKSSCGVFGKLIGEYTISTDGRKQILPFLRVTTTKEEISIPISEIVPIRNHKARMVLVTKLTNQKDLANIAKTDFDLEACQATIKKISSQTILSEIVLNACHEEVRSEAYSKLIDETALSYVAKNCNDIDIRKSAFKKLTDQAILADVAQNSKYIEIRKSAIEKLTDQTVLADIAKNDPDKDLRYYAIKKLTDQTVLAEIAKNDSKEYIRKSAIEKLTDQTILADVAKNDSSNEIRGFAINKLIDQEILADIVLNTSDKNVRNSVLEKWFFSNSWRNCPYLVRLKKQDWHISGNRIVLAPINQALFKSAG